MVVVSAGPGALSLSFTPHADTIEETSSHPTAALPASGTGLTGQDSLLAAAAAGGVPLSSPPLHPRHVADPSLHPIMAQGQSLV